VSASPARLVYDRVPSNYGAAKAFVNRGEKPKNEIVSSVVDYGATGA